MSDAASLPRLYRDLAPWFHLLTAPADYAEEAGLYAGLFEAHSRPVRTLLELGSGGGNNASHLKASFDLTLTDLSPEMLAVSRTLNPELEHVEGDMRTLRLGRRFDGLFAHDATSYLTSVEDLRALAETAAAHLEPGGLALFHPDHVRENFRSETHHGGHDGADGRGLRYLEWTHDPDPSDDWYQSDFVYLLRHADGTVESVLDRHTCGMLPRSAWLEALAAAGFDARVLPFDHSEVEAGSSELFAAVLRR
jgi:SAM-dependent methyltransferase